MSRGVILPPRARADGVAAGPFYFYKGNTFVAIGRTLIQDLLREMSPLKAHGFRTVVGHYIARTAGAEGLSKALDEIE